MIFTGLEAFAASDRALFADILEGIRRGSTVVFFESDTGVLAREMDTGLFMLASSDGYEGVKLLEKVIATGEAVVYRGFGDNRKEIHNAMLARGTELGYAKTKPCVQILYEKKELLPLEGTLEFRHPEESDYGFVRSTYHIVSDDELTATITSDDFFCGYDRGGHAVTYAGIHPEGSLGLLYVTPECRGLGYGRETASFMINHQTELGRLPYGQVYADNEASLALQKKLGFTFSRAYTSWMWKPEE